MENCPMPPLVFPAGIRPRHAGRHAGLGMTARLLPVTWTVPYSACPDFSGMTKAQRAGKQNNGFVIAQLPFLIFFILRIF